MATHNDGAGLAAKLWWVVPAGGFILLLLLATLIGPPEAKPSGSSYDSSKDGYRAAYLLLEELGYPVEHSRRPAGGSVRWVLTPKKVEREAMQLDDWVRDGGTLVLGDATGEFARVIGISPEVHKDESDPGEQEGRGVPGVDKLVPGPQRVDWPDQAGEVWAWSGDEPFVTVYPRGRGKVWLLHRPEFLTNRLIGLGDNGVLVCRLAEATLGDRAGPVAFDEFFHGLRDRPGVAELLLRPPTLWVTLQGLLVVALLVWHHGPRFGGPRPAPQASRRSKEEFLDALASLLERKGDFAEAYRTARDDLVAAMEREFGLPPGLPSWRLAAEAQTRRGVRPESLLPLLEAAGPPGGPGPAAFVKAMHQLEKVRDELLPRRQPR